MVVEESGWNERKESGSELFKALGLQGGGEPVLAFSAIGKLSHAGHEGSHSCAIEEALRSPK